MTGRIIAFVLLSLISIANLRGAEPNAFCFTCDFMQKHQDSAWQVVDRRTFAAQLDSPFVFSLGNFSYRLVADSLSQRSVGLQSQVNCIGNPPRNYFDQKVVMKGASVFFDSALVRGDSYYRIRLTFDSLGYRISDCKYRYSDSSFQFDPSGKYDFYYVKSSLGDIRWNQVRDAFEFDYKKISPLYKLTDQSKINFFISPCELPDIGWDPRWHNAMDVSRNNVFSQYSQDANYLSMEVVLMLRLLRNWGYAPALLLEGAATAPDFCDLFAQEYWRKKQLPELTAYGKSLDYRLLDETLSESAAGSFVGYLLKTRGLETFRDWYQKATDLSVPQTFETAYGEKMFFVEQQWHKYLDTLQLPEYLYRFHSDRAQSFMQFEEMLAYNTRGLAATHDTAFFASALAGLYYTYGDYQQAAKLFRFQVEHDTAKVVPAMFLANMLYAQGNVAAAESLYTGLLTTDTSDTYAYQKLAQIDLARNEPNKALELLKQAATKNKLPANGVDIDLDLAEAYAAAGQKDSAQAHFQAALDHSKIMISSGVDNPLHYLRAGIAALGLGSAKLALDYFNTAFFLEERMFYLGRVFVGMGKAYDLLGERPEALKYYHKVLDLPTAYADRQEARKLLESAYHK